MKNKFKVLFLLLNLSFIPSMFSEDLKVRRVLSTDKVAPCICQDKDGLFWIGTEGEGLFCYDGSKLKKIKIMENDTSFLMVWSIFVDKEGLIWFFVQNHGLFSYNKNTGICTKHTPERLGTNSPTGNNSNYLNNNVIGDEDGLIWFGTVDGLNSFDKNSGKFTQYKHDPNNPNSLSNDVVWTVFVGKDGLIWIGTIDGLNSYNKKTGKFSCYEHEQNNPNSLSDNHINAIVEDKEGNLWIGTKNSGIDKFDRRKNSFTNYRHDPNNPNSLSYNDIFHIMVDQFNNLWICNGGGTGIDLYNIATNTFRHYDYDPKDSNSISSNDVVHCIEDNIGAVWLATSSGCINRCVWKQDVFQNYSHVPKDSSSICSNNIVTLCEDRNGNIWLGTFRGGLSLYTRDGKFENYKHDANDPSSLPATSVSSILNASNNKLWLGFQDNTGTINLFDTVAKKVIKTFKNSYSNYAPCLLTKDNKDSSILWFAFFDQGELFKLDTQSGIFTQYKHVPENINSVGNEPVFSMLQDGDLLWLGTAENGLIKFDKKTEKCAHYKHNPEDKSSISGNTVTDLCIDGKGNFWIATEDGGLNKFDRETERFTSYGVKSGFISNRTRHILEDKEGFLWISTNAGIAKFDSNTLKVVRLFTKADGLLSYQFNIIANALKDSKGNFWFSTLEGVCKFNPEEANKIEPNKHIPPIVLSSFKSKEGTYNENGLRKLAEINLPWPDNSFGFTIAALDYTNPEKNQYAYNLEGFDKNWNYIGTNNFGQYSNLNPGEYTLRLKGSNNDGIWNEEGISIRITITPPFYITSWFKGLMGLVIFSILGGAVHLRIRALKKRAEYVKDHAIAETTAQVAHDIRSPLAALNMASKCLTGLPEQERVLIRNATNRISDITNNLLTKYKLKDDEKEKHLKTELVSSLLEHLISEKRFQMMEQSIELVLGLGDNTHSCFVNLDPAKFKRTVSNLINNASEAIHHTKGVTKLTLEKSADTLTIKIIDNGKGIPADILPRIKQGGISVGKKGGFGLGISGAIQNIKSWGGSYDIQSNLGEGTTFIIKLPIVKEPDWFQSAITLSQNMCIVILDDDESIHNVWETHFQSYTANKSVTLDHFYEPLAFTEYCKTSRSENDLFLVDYELINSKETGLDLIERLDLKRQAILVTSRYEDSEIRERIRDLKIKIIPKSFAPHIPISIKELYRKTTQSNIHAGYEKIDLAISHD